MELPRRKFLHLTIGAGALAAWLDAALALDYPTRPVHLIVGFPAGFTPDIIARLTAEALSERPGRQIIVDNRPGAASNIGTELVVKALPDGYTLLGATGANAINATLYENLSFNFIRDIAPDNVRRAADPARSHIDLARIGFGVGNELGNRVSRNRRVHGHDEWSTDDACVMVGVDLVHVPYRANLVPDLLAGQVQLVFAPIPTVIGQLKAGKLRALAVTSTTRVMALPNTPTMTEFVSGYEASTWFGIGAPNGISAEIIVKLNKEVNACLADPTMIERLTDLGSDPIPMTPAEFGNYIAEQTAKWERVIRTSNIKPE